MCTSINCVTLCANPSRLSIHVYPLFVFIWNSDTIFWSLFSWLTALLDFFHKDSPRCTVQIFGCASLFRNSEILRQLASLKWKKQHLILSWGNKDLTELYAVVSKSDLDIWISMTRSNCRAVKSLSFFTLIVLLLVVLLFVELLNVASMFWLIY